MNSVKNFWNSGIVGKLVIGGVGLLVICCVCSVPIAVMNPSTQTTEGQNSPAAEVEASPIGAQTEQPTDVSTVAPTETPEPTETPLPPTATEDPNLIKPGTHLVGTDIQPGIYRGDAGDNIFNSCYWARLKDLSGSFDALVANDNSVGQFYVEVRESDKALETHCELVRLVSLPASTGQFPQLIKPGMYLVGSDIQPGTYRGETGSDISASCYWERLSNVSGAFDALLANDNAIGQFYVQVAASDFALSTACELERAGD
jgi:hypothetical protein